MEYRQLWNGKLGGAERIDPMTDAQNFMERWEAEKDVSIGDPPNVCLPLLDECLRDYSAQCAAARVTASLFEVSA